MFIMSSLKTSFLHMFKPSQAHVYTYAHEHMHSHVNVLLWVHTGTQRVPDFIRPHTTIPSLWTLLGSVAWHYGAVCNDLNPSCKHLGVCYSCSLPKVLTYNPGVSPGSVYWLQGAYEVFSVMSVSAWIQHVPRLMFIVRSSLQSVMWGGKLSGGS